jgi:fructose-bisphosphate aldolase class I
MSKFIAAMDHSGGSTGGVLERYEQEYTEADKMDKVHAMRLRMINSPDFNDENIWGAILYKDTVDRGIVSILKAKGIEAILKVDSGCRPNGTLNEFDLAPMIAYALEHGCYGTKMRSIVRSSDMVKVIVNQQLTKAKRIFDAGLMPIVEPEVSISCAKKVVVERHLVSYLKTALQDFEGKCILKLTPPDENNLYYELTNHPKVEKVVALSGGYSTNEACNRLGLQDNMTASFSRGLSEGLTYSQTMFEFNAKISSNIKMIFNAGS